MISAYTVFLCTALLVFWVGIYRHLKSIFASIFILTSALVGARIFHVLINISAYRKNLSLITSLNFQGLSLLGAGIAVFLIAICIKKYTRVPIWKFSDAMVPYVGISIAIARIGCFINGCCFGIVSNLPWAFQYPLFSEAHLSQVARGQTNLMVSLPVHPTQLYEAVGAILSVCIARWVYTKNASSGIATSVFIASFSCIRLSVHFLRIFPDSFGSQSVFPLVYGFILIICSVIFNNRHKLAFGKK